jgi:CheY-like chemotaxis protein
MKAHILIIDDDQSILEMMRLVLEEEGGYRVTTAESIFEDVAAVERLQPDLILLDFLLQGRNTGWNFLQKLRLHRPTKDIPIVLCTAALSDVKDQESILIQKGIPVLYKPFDVDELLHIVDQILSSPHTPE